MITAAPARDAVLSCSRCWSGNGDTTDPGSGATVCWSCLAELEARRAVTPASPLCWRGR